MMNRQAFIKAFNEKRIETNSEEKIQKSSTIKDYVNNLYDKWKELSVILKKLHSADDYKLVEQIDTINASVPNDIVSGDFQSPYEMFDSIVDAISNRKYLLKYHIEDLIDVSDLLSKIDIFKRYLDAAQNIDRPKTQNQLKKEKLEELNKSLSKKI